MASSASGGSRTRAEFWYRRDMFPEQRCQGSPVAVVVVVLLLSSAAVASAAYRIYLPDYILPISENKIEDSGKAGSLAG